MDDFLRSGVKRPDISPWLKIRGPNTADSLRCDDMRDFGAKLNDSHRTTFFLY